MSKKVFIKVGCTEELDQQIVGLVGTLREEIPNIKIDKSKLMRHMLNYSIGLLEEELRDAFENDNINSKGLLYNIANSNKFREE